MFLSLESPGTSRKHPTTTYTDCTDQPKPPTPCLRTYVWPSPWWTFWSDYRPIAALSAFWTVRPLLWSGIGAFFSFPFNLRKK
jgi:hypothetical protein